MSLKTALNGRLRASEGVKGFGGETETGESTVPAKFLSAQKLLKLLETQYSQSPKFPKAKTNSATLKLDTVSDS